ncbi:hypothetical protein FHS27_001731 [Rhodopirellula rubra]|uniref:Uncharacterized protein n=2 Tax=Aporhodopirellula rubra TaxID=980271 RepID=A0A7W5DWP0_9BACT|nr:hypothetical protein [Aporhodopirellula rubra]
MLSHLLELAYGELQEVGLVAHSNPITYAFTRETITSFNNKWDIPAEQLDRVTVQWPDGTEASYANVTADKKWLITQNETTAFAMSN